MAKKRKPIDKVRASRDGHEYHEAWAARHAMQLLLPNAKLSGIAVEGLAPEDQSSAADEVVEIADLTFYHGGRAATFGDADKVRITQFKYSISKRTKDFRVADAKKTVQKFAKAYGDLTLKQGARPVRDKVSFELNTNRPIYDPFLKALKALAAGKPVAGAVRTQADEFKAACGLSGGDLARFAAKCRVQSLYDTLRETKAELTRTVVAWSGDGGDALARSRLGDLKQLVRDKAGFAGDRRNVIRHTDVLAALGLSEASDLLPCPAALVDVGSVLEREQLGEAIRLVPVLNRPLLVHAAGGVGKTVFMDSLCRALSADNEVVFFDCFGGGDYRAPGDARHHPKRGLVHIANTLACRGLCDPILPGVPDPDSLILTFRRRLEQCIKTISSGAPNGNLILFLDAIDNAAGHAHDRREQAFPVLLATSLQSMPIEGVKLVVSSRTHRIPLQDVAYEDFELRAFSNAETASFLRARLPDVSPVEIRVAHARSGGNARVLEYLLATGRRLLDESEIDRKLELTELIQARIDRALQDAVMIRGYKTADIAAFLAGLAVLPPPVPLEEYAEAQGMDVSAIESFAADLRPLLERTKYGLTFRDEPTEGLVRDRYASIQKPLRRVANNLLAMQDRSVYAARALPDLLLKLGDAKGLFKLAFNKHFPSSISSTVGERNIRAARLKAAIRYAGERRDYDQLVHLTVELSTIAAVESRGATYILDFPDLVIASQDTDATRRLFETRTNWQGARHARLAIANALSGDADEAYRHAAATEDWLHHYWRQSNDVRPASEGPQALDNAAVPFCLFTQRRFEQALRTINRWEHDYYSFEVAERVFHLVQQPTSGVDPKDIKDFVDHLTDEGGCIAAALSFLALTKHSRRKLVAKLARYAGTIEKLKLRDNIGPSDGYGIQDGMRKAAAIALSYGECRKALRIAKCVPHDRPGLWSFRDHFSDSYVFPYIVHVALKAAAQGVDVREKDLLPREVAPIAAGIPNGLVPDEFRTALGKRLEKRVRAIKEGEKPEEGTISHEDKGRIEHYIAQRLPHLLLLTNALTKVFRSPKGRADAAFKKLIEAWAEIRAKGRDDYRPGRFNLFFQLLGCQVAAFVLWSRDDVKAKSVNVFLSRLHEQETVHAGILIEVIDILARRPYLQSLAGREARHCVSLIDSENDVTHRASLYARLARAILAGSPDEAKEYFRAGLEQMDAIGSGDYGFTNELLLLAASLRGRELNDSDVHTLTNICELNLTDEPEKFPWCAFGQGLSRASGWKGLAKLSRWDDRSKVSLTCTLLPYLTALLRDKKIAPQDAVALNWLADPVEFWSCNTENFARAVESQISSSGEAVVVELIAQYEATNPGPASESTVRALADIAKRVLGAQSELGVRLSVAHPRFGHVRDVQNDFLNYRGRKDGQRGWDSKSETGTSRRKVKRVSAKTDPADEKSLSVAIEELCALDDLYIVRDAVMDEIRSKVPYGKRAQYIRNLARLEHMNLYWKLDEFQKCHVAWSGSSTALRTAYREVAALLVRLHVDELVSHDHVSGSQLKQLSDLSGTSVPQLALDLIQILAERGAAASATIWLGLACWMADEAADGEGQKAIERVLRSDAARLSEGVQDGRWKKELYPGSDPTEVAAGLVWRQLGSPSARARWCAAHSLRSFGRLGRWQVIDAVVGKFDHVDAGPFQAPEAAFYFLHARLWLLIALARIAQDEPRAVAKYKKALLQIVQGGTRPHVLLRHFAARALLAAVDAGALALDGRTERVLRGIDHSPLPRLHTRLKKTYEDGWGHRPKSAPKPAAEFSLEYDFGKEDVQYLSNVFGQPHWRVADLVAEAAHEIDPRVKNMYDLGGRESSNRVGRGLDSKYHVYGEQLGWHAMMITAGRLLATKPVTDDWWREEPWQDWLSQYILTRKDGLWLSDGRDVAPLRISTILMEKGEDGLILTGDKRKILDLLNLNVGIGKEIVVAGHWFSADHVRVRINSVLASPKDVKTVVKELLDEEPIRAWLPAYEECEDESDRVRDGKAGCIPWIVWPSLEVRLDRDDPLTADGVVTKPHLASAVTGVRPRDPFGRVWEASGKLARSEAWSYATDREGESRGGTDLFCSKALLKDVLAKNDADLILLVDLQRYEQGFRHELAKYRNTVAIIRIKKSMEIQYYKGRVNHLWKVSW